ncbi:MAG: response regulator [Candidatus Competibacteraceae bacterium]|nr:response regulator [Candidatus Competibacteraceae bacterium]
MINRIMASPVTRSILLGLTVLSLASIAWSVYGFAAAQMKAFQQNALEIASERYVSALKDVQSGYRGYLNLGTDEVLQPYLHAKAELDRYIATFKNAATGTSLPAEIPARMIAEGQKVVEHGDRVVAARKRSIEEARAVTETRAGNTALNKVRESFQDLESWSQRERAAITDRTERVYIPVAINSLFALALVISVFVYVASKTKRASMRAQSLLADVIERAPVGLALLDRNLHINQANNAFAKMAAESGAMRTGQALAATASQLDNHLRPRIHGALAERFRFQDANADQAFELSVGDKSRHVRADVFPVTLVTEAGTESPGVGIVLNDVTRQRQAALELETARDEAESANRAKSAFIANMSHELRTPLTAVLGYCELIEEDLRDLGEEALLADLNKINLNARHLLGLINDVLDLSKIEAQKMDVHAIEFTLGSLLHEVEAATGGLLAKNDNTLTLTAEAPDTVMATDDLKIKQILLNLIGNAAKFTTQGQITVHAAQIEENGVPHTRFSVADTGIGMSQDQLANLFQRFTQADQTTTRKYGGTGLGLALTRALSGILGGRINVASVEGQGTTFTVTVPTRYQKPAVAIESDASADSDREGKSTAPKSKVPSVLVVDDDPAARELLTRHLEREGFSVTTAASGREGLESIKAHRPLAVLLDVLMPGLDGWHVLRAIRQDPETQDIPVIMQTVVNEKNFAYALGATGYLKKPVRRHDLTEALQGIKIPKTGQQVLIVDDDKAANERLMEMLHRDGWNCRMALNGTEGLKALADAKPDLVLVDLIMPEMDGYAFIREVRKNPDFDALPLVVMTAEDVQSGKVRSLANDTAGIVQKGSMPLADLVADLRRFAEQAKNQ